MACESYDQPSLEEKFYSGIKVRQDKCTHYKNSGQLFRLELSPTLSLLLCFHQLIFFKVVIKILIWGGILSETSIIMISFLVYVLILS